MNIVDRIRIKRKIRRMCKLMEKKMSKKDILECVQMIKWVLRQLSPEKKEGLLDVCLGVLKNEC